MTDAIVAPRGGARFIKNVAETLRHEIERGRFAQSQLLPGERTLCEALGSFALDAAQGDRRADFAKGCCFTAMAPAPSFIARRRASTSRMSRLTSFTEDMELRGFVASSRLLERGHLPADAGRGDDARRRTQRARFPAAPAQARQRHADGDRTRGRCRCATCPIGTGSTVRSTTASPGTDIAPRAACSVCARSCSATMTPSCSACRRKPGALHPAHRLSAPTASASSSPARGTAATPTTSSPSSRCRRAPRKAKK